MDAKQHSLWETATLDSVKIYAIIKITIDDNNYDNCTKCNTVMHADLTRSKRPRWTIIIMSFSWRCAETTTRQR